jgi:predicted nucleic acid-binding Zn ribbon protein
MSTWVDSGDRGRFAPALVGQCLDPVARRLGLGSSAAVSALFARWEALVGPALATHVRPWSLRGGVLKLVADDPAWAAQIRFLASDLLARVRDATGQRNEVRELVVKVGSLPDPW